MGLEREVTPEATTAEGPEVFFEAGPPPPSRAAMEQAVAAKHARSSYGRAMAKLSAAAAGYSPNRKRSGELLQRAFDEADAATLALHDARCDLAEARAHARRRSGLGGWEVAYRVRAFGQAGLHEEAFRLVRVTEALDLELFGIARAVAHAGVSPADGQAQLEMVSRDAERTPRARLHALWWLVQLGQAEVSHQVLRDIVSVALERKDAPGLALAIRALYSVLGTLAEDPFDPRLGISELRWPGEGGRDRWAECGDPDDPLVIDSWRMGPR